MSEFVASNGIEVNKHSDGSLWWEMPLEGDSRVLRSAVPAADVRVLREFFQAKRDDELRRWRWPKNPDYVVYPRVAGGVRVVEERTGQSGVFSRSGDFNDLYGEVAVAYFEAHPEPKPWADAKPGEVWLIELDGAELAVMVDTDGYWRSEAMEVVPEEENLTIIRRIWPEEA